MSNFIFEVHNYPRVEFLSPVKSVHTEFIDLDLLLRVRIGGETVLTMPVIVGERYCIPRDSEDLGIYKLKEPYDEKMLFFWKQGFRTGAFKNYLEDVEVKRGQKLINLDGLAVFTVNYFEKEGFPKRVTVDRNCDWSIRRGAELKDIEEKFCDFICEVQEHHTDIDDLLGYLMGIFGNNLTVHSPNINKKCWEFSVKDEYITIEYNYKMKSYSGVIHFNPENKELLYAQQDLLKKVKLIET